jgi:hypothetical protein
MCAAEQDDEQPMLSLQQPILLCGIAIHFQE